MAIYKSAKGEFRVSVPLINGTREQIERRKALNVYGLGDVMVIDAQGVLIGTGIGAVAETQPALAYEEVRHEETQQRLPSGASNYVLQLIMAGCFEGSDWALWYGLPKTPPTNSNESS